MPKTKTQRGSRQHIAHEAQPQAEVAALLQSIGDGVVATDESGHITRINRAALDIMGYREAEVIGKWFPKCFVALDDSEKVVNPLERPVTRAMLTGNVITQKMYYITKKRTLVPVAVTVSPILIKDTPVGVVEVFRDITKEQEIDRMKGEFISIASHQLRTPLTAIKTYAHLLASDFRGKLNKQQKEFVDTILASIARMNELINILLDVSRIEEGKIHVLLKETSVNELAQHIVAELKEDAKTRKITVKLICESDSTLMIDQVLTTEVLTNLLSNSIKYTPPGGKVKFSVHETKRDICFTISDSGYGIPESDQGHVFTKFFRADNVRVREPSGTGLGLYMVKQLVDNLGGSITFESTEEKGTTFVVTFPKQKVTRAE